MLSRARGRRALAGLGSVAVLAGLAAPTAASATPEAAPEPAPAAAPGPSGSVTLVTGDRVTVTNTPGGQGPSVTVAPAPDRDPGVTFQVRTTPRPADGAAPADDAGPGGGGVDIEVVPSDAWALLQAGRLDPALFDIDQLLASPARPAGGADLPLIVTHGSGARAAVARGAVDSRALPSIDGTALVLDAERPGAFWESVTAPGDGAGARVLDADVAGIWLDAPLRAAMDRSGPEIGVPAAREAGLTGAGVTVAVLDTGVDTDHPDLADVVAAERDFTGSASGADDRTGHGTHVASIIAGDGTASDGRFAGVAPEVALLNGKVLGDDGSGATSWAIAGLEWAVAQDADVVNLSLGGGLPSDGSDPLSLAVERLTEDTGTLFVVAAGNAGVVESPGAAPAALTVGSVDRSGAVSRFSGQGPTLDGRLKPELTAPGEGIVAAWPDGVPPPAEPPAPGYAALTGTSMATPQVAGAAALLAQADPELDAAGLKALLMASAAPTADATGYAQGAGRVDLARALDQPVSPQEPAVSVVVPAPWEAREEMVTFRNEGAGDVTLDLALTPDDRSGVVALGADRLVVPAGGTAAVPLVIDGAAGGEGAHSGVLTATGPDGAPRVSVPWGVVVEPPSQDVELAVTDREGRPVTDLAAGFSVPPLLLLLDRGQVSHSFRSAGDTLKARVPEGRYTLLTWVNTMTAEGVAADVTLVTVPEVVVAEESVALTADARRATPVRAEPESATAVPDGSLYGVDQPNGQFGLYVPEPAGDLYAVPVEAPPSVPQSFYLLRWLHEPDPAASGGIDGYDLAFLHLGEGIPEDLVHRVEDAELARVTASAHAEPGVPLDGAWGRALLVPELGEGGQLNFPQTVPLPAPGETTRLLTATGPDGRPRAWISDYVAGLDGTPLVGEISSGTDSYEPGQAHRLEWRKGALGPALFVAVHGSQEMVLNAGPAVGSAPGHRALGVGEPQEGLSQTVALWRDGTLVSSGEGHLLWEVVPPEEARYVFETRATRETHWASLATEVTARWEFTSRGAAPGGSSDLALPTLRVGGAFDGENRAPAGEEFALDLTVDGWQGRAAEPAASVELAASFDDGASWRPLPVTGADHVWRATVEHPADGEFVSLRAEVTGQDGTVLEQTVLRAYALAPGAD
ncbi:S8 family serine peptidase [Streptomyces sp. DSM 44915]|uniref:S8 family serine peptidase n=1 Tax=Streptomyces chisholmiae TaxID=3075540 RepID=A0ABU2JNK1_9ACTN|nr:S8 family serine peptidase [Streptomyces sp. DSM 44915]MDT0266567.1 S8 family serine peptidase [Streptomyces sp. DSM 44915]